MSAYNDLILSDTPTVMWTLDDAGSRVGGVVTDSSGNGYDGSEYSPAGGTVPAGLVGDGQPCDDWTNSGKINGPAGPLYADQSDHSIEIWFRPDIATPGINKVMACQWSSASPLWILAHITDGRIRAAFRDSVNANVFLYSDAAVTVDEIYHVVYTISTTNGHKLYINGVLHDSDPDTFIKSVTQRTVTVGNYTLDTDYNATNTPDAAMDKFSFYPYELTESQISGHYNWLSSGGSVYIPLQRRRRRI